MLSEENLTSSFGPWLRSGTGALLGGSEEDRFWPQVEGGPADKGGVSLHRAH